MSHDLVEPGGVDGQMDHAGVGVGVAEPGCRRPVPVRGAVVHDDEHPGRVLVLRPAHDLADQVHEGNDAGGAGGGGPYFPGAHVEGGQQGQGTVADVFVLDPHGRAACSRDG